MPIVSILADIDEVGAIDRRKQVLSAEVQHWDLEYEPVPKEQSPAEEEHYSASTAVSPGNEELQSGWIHARINHCFEPGLPALSGVEKPLAALCLLNTGEALLVSQCGRVVLEERDVDAAKANNGLQAIIIEDSFSLVTHLFNRQL